jgi:D-methionine transport system ATP-binding protein
MAMIRCEQVELMTTDFQPSRLRSKSIARPILQEISFDLAAQQIVGLVGATGAGKSSLLKLLNRLVDPSQGTLYWQGQPYRQLPVQQLRHQIMLVLPEPQLLGMTVAQSLVYGLKLRGQPEAQLKTAMAQWQERLQIPADWLGQSATELSLGQRHWVTIARGIACEPAVLMLDEPVAHLDQHYADQLHFVLSKLLTRSTQLIVIASHDWQWLSRICNRVLYLQQGRLVQNVAGPELDWTVIGQMLQTEMQAIAQEWL